MKDQIPNPGFVQVFKEGILLALRWLRPQPGGVIEYAAVAGVAATSWRSDEVDIRASDQDHMIMEGAWKGIDKKWPGLWEEMLIAPDHLMSEIRHSSHPQTFNNVSELGREIMTRFLAAEKALSS